MKAGFRSLLAWQASHEVVLSVYRATKSFPDSERYGLTSQARRAAFSAAANLVEGSARRGKREFRRFVDIPRGSLAELEYILLLAHDLGYLTYRQWNSLEKLRGRAGFLTWRLYRRLTGLNGSRA